MKTTLLTLLLASQLLAQPKPARAPGIGRMMEQLRSKDWILCADALEYLAKHRAREAKIAVQKLVSDEQAQSWLRGRALIALARIDGKSAVDLILQFSEHQDHRLRAAAAEAMQYANSKDIEKPLATLLKDESPEVSSRALASFAKRHGTKAWSLVDPGTVSLGAQGCEWGVKALAFVGNDAAIKRLTDLARRKELLPSLLRGLQGARNPKLIGVLLDVLTNLDANDPDFTAGLSLLQQFEEDEILRTLKVRLKSGDARVIRTVASIVIEVPRNPELGDALRLAALRIDDRNTLREALLALGRRSMNPDRHQALFVRHLTHKDVEIRALAIRGLAHCSSVDLYKHLRDRLADESPEIVEAALGALLRAPASAAPRGKLIAHLKAPLGRKHPTVRKLAFELLAHAGTSADFKPAMDLLGEYLRSTDDEARTEVATAIGKLASEEQFESVVRIQGYLSRWQVIGTFPSDPTFGGFKAIYPPEDPKRELDFKAKYKANYAWVLRGNEKKEAKSVREIGWTKVTVDQTDGRLIFPPLLPPPGVQVVAYAVADFQVESGRQVLLNVDGDDGFRIWLNGKKLAEKLGAVKYNTPNVVSQSGIKLDLRAGANRILVKTVNLDRDWWIRLRLTDDQGRPVVFKPQR